MKSSNKDIKVPTRYLSEISAVLLWLLLIIFPAMAGKMIFSAAIAMEKQLENSRIRQKLSIELQKFATVLEPREWLRNALHSKSFDELVTRLYDGETILEDYKKHPFLCQMPVFEDSTPADIEKFSRHFQSFIGTRPDVVLVMGEEAADCGWQLSQAFRSQQSEEKIRQNLALAWQVLSKRLASQTATLQAGGKFFADELELSKILGIFDTVSTGLKIAAEHFSTHTNAEIFISLFPVPDNKGRFDRRFILAAVSITSMNPEFMLRKACKSLTNRVLEHSFGHTGQQLLPFYNEEDGKLSLIGSTPESFRKLAWKHIQSGKRPLAIRVSERKLSGFFRNKISTANMTLLLYVMIATWVMAGIRTGRFSSFQRIDRLVAAGLFAAILLPLSGATWLGICYLNTRKHLEAENTINWMQNTIFTRDSAIKLQLARNALFRNIFAAIISEMPSSELKNLNNRLGFFAPDSNGVSEPKSVELTSKIESYVIYHPELDDIIGVNNHHSKISETPHLFFGSPAREALFQLGAMNHIAPDKLRQMINKTQYTMGFLDNVIDNKLVSKVFAEEQSAVENTVSVRREQLTASFWKGPANSLKGISILHSTNSSWRTDFYQMLKAGMVREQYSYNGYRIFFHIFLRHSYNSRQLSEQYKNSQVPENFALGRIWQLAEALFSFGDSARINNLDAVPPHLICAGPAANGDAWIMAIAEPESSAGLLSGTGLLVCLVFLAVLTSLVLARGLSLVLLRPISAFEEAVSEMGRQNFNFSLQIKNGDEFDQLGDSFNNFSRKLYEKAKLSQLVSRNVLDAISAADGQTLKPGGSRVEASILFADLRGFTTIAEQNPPEAVVSMLNDYFSLMAECIERHGGLIDKLIGDAIQAVFYAHENSNCAECAVKAGLEMRSSLSIFNKQRKAQGLFTIDNGVGICTGSVICGRVGSEHGMLDATIIGSLVNRAAHLENLSKHGVSSKVFIDEATSLAISPLYARHEPEPETNGTRVIELQI